MSGEASRPAPQEGAPQEYLSLGELAGQAYRATRDELQTEGGELITGLFVPTAGLLDYLFAKGLESNDPSASAVVLELSNQVPTATGRIAPDTHKGIHISTAGEIGLVGGPMLLTASVIAACALWRRRQS